MTEPDYLFKRLELFSKYTNRHPLLGDAYYSSPLLDYKTKQALLEKSSLFKAANLTIDSLIMMESARVKEVIDAVSVRGNETDILDVVTYLYPLLKEEVASGNRFAIDAYTPLINQIETGEAFPDRISTEKAGQSTTDSETYQDSSSQGDSLSHTPPYNSQSHSKEPDIEPVELFCAGFAGLGVFSLLGILPSELVSQGIDSVVIAICAFVGTIIGILCYIQYRKHH